MNDFLNLESILNGEKIYHTLKEMFSHPSNELYLCSALHELSNMNNSINELRVKTFKSILEADTKMEENNHFCIYFKEFKNIVDNFISKIDELAGKAIINIDNIVDANKDLIEDLLLVGDFSTFDMDVYEYQNLTNKEVPKFKAKKIFKKEFDHIGAMMQELGPVASDEAKLKIIATVYNTLQKDMEEEFLEKCAEKMLDDDYDKKKSLPEQLSALFKGEKCTKTIDKSDVQNAKSILMNAPLYTSSIREMADQLISDFTEVSNSLGDMLFRNKSYTLKIDTETDGIKNKEYELNTYSMNQFNIFMKAKTNQLMQICNMYMVAFSIKLDNIVEFIIQNKNILSIAQEANGPKTSKFDDDNGFTSTEPTGDEDQNKDVYSDDIEEPENNDPLAPSSTDVGDEKEEIDVEDDDKEDNSEKEISDEEKMETSKDNGEFELESYSFDFQLFNLEKIMEQEMLQVQFDELLEADNPETGTKNVRNLADNHSNKAVDIWRTIIEKITQLFEKFNDIFIKHTTSRIKYLDKHTAEIKKNNFANDATIRPYYIERFDDLKVFDLNYDNMKDDLNKKEDFIKRYYNKIEMKDDTSFSQAIKNYITPTESDSIDKIGKEKMLKFCTSDFTTMVNEIKQDKRAIDKAQQNAKRIASSISVNNNPNKTDDNKTGQNGQQDSGAQKANNTNSNNTKNESVVYTADDLYFDEAFNPGSAGKDKEQVNSVKKQLMVYFTVTSQVLSNKMSLANSAFNEYYRALYSLTNDKGDSPKKDEGNKGNNQEEK